MTNNKFNLLVVLTAMFAVCLVVSNIIAGKLITVFGLTLTSAVFVFPLVYIIGDIVPEVYGLQVARRVIWVGFFANLIAVLFFALAIILPYPPFFEGQEAYEIVLGFTPRLLFASFCGYLVGTNINAWTLVLIKKLTKEKWLWMRTIGSTIVGETADSIIFITLAFAFIVPWSAIPMMIFAQAAFKIIYEICATPLTYIVINFVKAKELAFAK